MTLTIGRVSGLRPKKGSPSISGNRVTFEGTIVSTSNLQLQALRHQLLGHSDNEDEKVVPVTWASDANFDGFYKVMKVSCQLRGPSTGLYADFSVDLERVTGYSNPWFEVMTQAIVRTNGHSVTAPTTILATYGTSTGETDFRPSLVSPTLSAARYDESGQLISIFEFVAPVAATQYRSLVFPSTYYTGSCKIELKFGSTWYPMVGRDIPKSTVWRISNGLVRFTAASGALGATPGTFEIWDQVAQAYDSAPIAHWTNGAPSSAIGYGSGLTVSSLTVIRNSPEQVVVRCAGAHQDYTYSIQRGAYLVTGAWTDTAAIKGGAGSATAGGIAGTAITGGIRRTANDANGNRMVYGVAAAKATDLVNTGVWYNVAATSGTVFWGCEMNGSAAIAGDTAAALVEQFLGAVSWQQRIVPR